MSSLPGRAGTLPEGAGDEAKAKAETAATVAASWRALGTLVQLVVTEPRGLTEARRLLEADLAAVDLACSRFRADSEICTLQATRGPQATPGPQATVSQQVSPLLAQAIAVALRAAELTDGDVDPTVGAAMSAVGYDRDFEQIRRRRGTRGTSPRSSRSRRPARRPEMSSARSRLRTTRSRGLRRGPAPA